MVFQHLNGTQISFDTFIEILNYLPLDQITKLCSTNQNLLHLCKNRSVQNFVTSRIDNYVKQYNRPEAALEAADRDG